MNLPVLILAGGLGTRVSKKYRNTQKCMIKFNGKPFIYYVLKNLEKSNLNRVILLLGYNSKEVIKYLNKNLEKFNITMNFSMDGKNLLGTGGSVKKALKLVDSDFAVTYADSYLNYDFKKITEFYKKNKIESLITIYNNKNGTDKNNILCKNNMIVYYNKLKNSNCHYIDWGFSIFNKKVFKDIKKKKFDLKLIYDQQIKKKKLHGFKVNKRYQEIGTPESIKKFRYFLSAKK